MPVKWTTIIAFVRVVTSTTNFDCSDSEIDQTASKCLDIVFGEGIEFREIRGKVERRPSVIEGEHIAAKLEADHVDDTGAWVLAILRDPADIHIHVSLRWFRY